MANKLESIQVEVQSSQITLASTQSDENFVEFSLMPCSCEHRTVQLQSFTSNKCPLPRVASWDVKQNTSSISIHRFKEEP